MQTIDTSSSSSLVPEPRVNIFIDRKLGSGRFEVFHAHMPYQQTEYAVKAFPKDEASQMSFQREKEITSSLSHENVIKYMSKIHLQGQESLDSDFLIMEYAPYGTFFELAENKGLTDEKLMRTYFRQLVEGLEHLHYQRIAHGDLKLENLLLGEDFILKITDFDQSQMAGEMKTEFTGTACYRAPEVLERTCSNFMAADVYSLGVLLYAFKAQAFPFVEKSGAAGTDLIHYDLFSTRNNEFWMTKGATKKNEAFFSQTFKDLVNGMLEKDPQRRFTLQDIKDSRWYNEAFYDKKELKTKMDKVWERIMFKKSIKRGKSFRK